MKNNQTKHYAIFAGGETAGPIMPLLALAKYWKTQDENIVPVFVDRRHSIGAHIIPKNNFIFYPITSGKLRRYLSIQNILSPLLIIVGFFQSIRLLLKLRPVVIVGAGGYVQVPIMIAAWTLRIPRVIHQLDVTPTFSNRLVTLIANRITTAFEKSVKDFPQGSGFEMDYGKVDKIFWTGNPCDLDAKFLQTKQAKDEAIKLFHLDKDRPTILIIGGSTGAQGLNNVISQSLPELLKIGQIIHATGKGKVMNLPHDLPEVHTLYHQYEFIDRRDLAYAAADIVISRAGIATITDLAVLGKASIIVPMPKSHQENNALFLYDNNAALILDQDQLTPEILSKGIKKVFFDAKLQKTLSENIHAIIPENASEKMLNVILRAIHD